MGKIRVSTLGSADEEAKKQKVRVKREEKKKRLAHISGMKGGEKLVDMSVDAPEIPASPTETPSDSDNKSAKLTKKQKVRSPLYQKARSLIDQTKVYPLSNAIDLIKKASIAKFDGSVEIHINCIEKGIRGQVDFPHGTGRQVKVAIANDELIDQLNSNKIDFDILVASPAMMPKLVKFAKMLGPKGLMPNPKSGTISDKPEELAKKLSSGQTQYKSESDFPIIHMVIGKVSFSNKDLEENFAALTTAIGSEKIKSIFIKSTMSPSVKVKI
ncbi:MAG: hypothetical protein V1858_05280 [Candidatus Gottesmanbacteria bacterium]